MGNKIKVRVRPVRLIIYLALVVFCVLFYEILKNAVWFQALILLIVAIVFSIVSLIYQSKKLSLKLYVTRDEIRRDEQANFVFSLKSTSFVPVSSVEIFAVVENEFFHTEGTFQIKMPVQLRGESKMTMPFLIERNGIVRLHTERVRLNDLLGIFYLVKEKVLESEVFVFPQSQPEGEDEKRVLEKALDAAKEIASTGNGAQSSGELRKYIPGDRWKDVHWKLSAKKQELLVKEKEESAREHIFVLLDGAGEAKLVDAVISLGYSLCLYFISHNKDVSLLWLDCVGEQVQRKDLTEERDIQESYMTFYRLGINGKENGSLVETIGKIEPDLVSYLLVTGTGETAGVKVIQNGMEKEN